jgi:formylglycine-generating enzyme required for sulfatase activity
VIRGGSFNRAASFARVSLRSNYAPDSQNDVLGLRPARASQLSASPLHRPVK